VADGRPTSCEECGSPLAGSQNYCLNCGARVGSRSPQLEALMSGAGESWEGRGTTAAGAAPQQQAEPAPATAGASRSSGLHLPPPGIAALMVLAFLAFGVLLGAAAGSRVADTLAAEAHPPLRIVLPAGAGKGPATSTSPSSSSSASESSGSEPEATPTRTASTTTTAASTKAASGSSEEGSSSEASAGEVATKLPPIKHVFLITLSNQPYSAVFGPESAARYLAHTLERKGELLVRYDAVSHEELPNEVALLSGQGPTVAGAANCPTYAAISPARTGSSEQVLGNGCIYPKSTQTLAGQLSQKHLAWRAYVQGIDEPGAAGGACAHPSLGASDPTSNAEASTGAYATFRNPFVYFSSIVGTPACASGDVGLDKLAGDLGSPARTPAFSYIVPDRCHDGNPTPCTPGATAGLLPANAFLQQVVPEILGSKAYKEAGLLVITVDQAPSSGEFADSSSCCGQPSFPNLPRELGGGGSAKGGGTVGALLLSPYVPGKKISQEKFNHFSLLRTIEDLFSLKHLGYAGLPAVKSFEPALFTSKPSG